MKSSVCQTRLNIEDLERRCRNVSGRKPEAGFLGRLLLPLYCSGYLICIILDIKCSALLPSFLSSSPLSCLSFSHLLCCRSRTSSTASGSPAAAGTTKIMIRRNNENKRSVISRGPVTHRLPNSCDTRPLRVACYSYVLGISATATSCEVDARAPAHNDPIPRVVHDDKYRGARLINRDGTPLSLSLSSSFSVSFSLFPSGVAAPDEGAAPRIPEFVGVAVRAHCARAFTPLNTQRWYTEIQEL